MKPKITWALLARTTPERLRAAIADGPRDPPWRLVLGRAGVHAIVDETPGSEHSGEREVALALSAGGRCDIGYADPPWISTCESGRWVKEEEGDLFELAESLGCPLAPARSFAPPPALSVLLAEGATGQALAAALSQPWPSAPDAAIQVRDAERGAVAWTGTVAMFDRAFTLSLKLGTTVYGAKLLPGGGVRCQVFADNDTVGRYDLPVTAWSEEPKRLDNVFGAIEPMDVMRQLGYGAGPL